MKVQIRRACVAFVLTLTILGTGTAGLLAYDRMDREIAGVPEASSREVVIGSHVRDFDLAAADARIEQARNVLKWIGGMPYAFFEVLYQGSEWVADSIREALF